MEKHSKWPYLIIAILAWIGILTFNWVDDSWSSSRNFFMYALFSLGIVIYFSPLLIIPYYAKKYSSVLSDTSSDSWKKLSSRLITVSVVTTVLVFLITVPSLGFLGNGEDAGIMVLFFPFYLIGSMAYVFIVLLFFRHPKQFIGVFKPSWLKIIIAAILVPIILFLDQTVMGLNIRWMFRYSIGESLWYVLLYYLIFAVVFSLIKWSIRFIRGN
jgi:hypothetical protein